jgi:hypothetical protein
MGIRKSLASIAAVALVASPLAAEAAPREAAPVEGEQLDGNPWIPIAVLFIVAAIILFVALDDETPDSP